MEDVDLAYETCLCGHDHDVHVNARELRAASYHPTHLTLISMVWRTDYTQRQQVGRRRSFKYLAHYTMKATHGLLRRVFLSAKLSTLLQAQDLPRTLLVVGTDLS